MSNNTLLFIVGAVMLVYGYLKARHVNDRIQYLKQRDEDVDEYMSNDSVLYTVVAVAGLITVLITSGIAYFSK